LACSAVAKQPKPPSLETADASSNEQVNRNQQSIVAAAHPLASRAGAKIPEQGGNAVDAAVASAFVLSVVEPSISGLGGRLQAIVRLPSGEVKGVDATTQAPLTYNADTAPQGRYGYPTIGIPAGVVAGLTKLLNDYGSMPLEVVMQSAIRYAEEGFELLPGEARRQSLAAEAQEFAGSRQYFIIGDSLTRNAGSRWIQQDLAKTLKAIAAGGANVFYQGEIARRIIDDIQANGGILTLEYLSGYKAKDAEILSSDYRGHTFHALSLTSYGAITLEIMNILENLSMQEANEATWATNMYRAIERAYEDRSKQYNDSINILISKTYAAQLADEIMYEASFTALSNPV
jgi:gamma-glutamyltranspeptidase / glutathione hydrolase